MQGTERRLLLMVDARKAGYYENPYINFENRKNGLNMNTFHYHDCHEIYILKTGRRRLMVDSFIYETSSFDAALLSPKQFHRSIGDSDYSGICIHFSERYLDKYYTESAKNRLLKCLDQTLISLTPYEFNTVHTLSGNISRNNSLAFVYLADILCIMAAAKSRTSGTPAVKSRPLPIIAYIQENYTNIKNLDEIAKALYMTKSYACNLFKHETGVTITHYINSLRIQLASDMLRETSEKIEVIAEKCGFESTSYFNKVFRKYMNKSPGEFRKAMLEDGTASVSHSSA